ncbi:MAG: hypothetical protein KQA41_03645 [Candidatus Aenigmarchaeota archaeon]|nr:hypothetical protein [Candidatus Aenigmarchaeota archaeon]
MHSLSNKAQFFILTAVVFAGFFYILSKYITPYSFIDTSKYAYSQEIFLFNNIKEKAIKTVKITQQNNPDDLVNNLINYRNYAQKIARDNGYILFFEFTNTTTSVSFNMTLSSEKIKLTSSFIVPR